MTWSKQPPTEPGWYWWRQFPDSRPMAESVQMAGGELRLVVEASGTGYDLEGYGGEWWLDPIAMPGHEMDRVAAHLALYSEDGHVRLIRAKWPEAGSTMCCEMRVRGYEWARLMLFRRKDAEALGDVEEFGPTGGDVNRG